MKVTNQIFESVKQRVRERGGARANNKSQFIIFLPLKKKKLSVTRKIFRRRK